jgi:RNA polymerase sigma factor (sigma-70 family)
MDCEQIFFEYYGYITKIVQKKAITYDLDYDACVNYVVEKISEDYYKKLRAFRGESKFKTYITVVVNRLIINFARIKKNPPELSPIITETPLDFLIKKQQRDFKELFLKLLPHLLNELTPMERLVIKLRYFKNFKFSQISRELNTTRHEIKKILASGLGYLRDSFNKKHKN